MSGTEWGWNPETLAAVATSAIALLGLIAVLPVIEMRRDRHARLIRDVLRDWDGLETIREDLAKKENNKTLRRLVEDIYDPTPPQATEDDKAKFLKLQKIASFMDDLGGLVKQKALSVKTVEGRLGSAVLDEYKDWHKAIDAAQEHYDDAWEDFRWLAQQLAAERGKDLEALIGDS